MNKKWLVIAAISHRLDGAAEVVAAFLRDDAGNERIAKQTYDRLRWTNGEQYAVVETAHLSERLTVSERVLAWSETAKDFVPVSKTQTLQEFASAFHASAMSTSTPRGMA